MIHNRRRALGLLILASAILAPAFSQGRRGGGMAPPDNLSFRFMGPAVGNRISAAAGIPGDPTTYYIGAASGGVWKSTNSGQSWAPIFDQQSAMAIGSLAVAPSDPKTVWAGTGEACAIRDSDMQGDGIYKSTDSGATWKNVGLVQGGRIGHIVIHPKNPDVVYACVAGRITGPQKERGVFRTRDGGQTWDHVLAVDENTGCSGLSMDPNNPDYLVAGTWQAEMHTYAMFSGGPGSGVFITHDGGNTWKRATSGMPKPPVGKIDVKIAPSNPKRVYALIQTADQGSLWRSEDSGENWNVVNWQRALIGRAGYYIHLNVSPTNADEVLVANSSFWLSTDGGKSFRTQPWGGDTHDIWIDPKDPNRILVTHDGGMYMTTDHGRTSNRVTLPIGQIYHVAVDNDVPYKIYGNMQDDGTMRGPSNVVEAGPNVPGMGGGNGRGAFLGGRGGGEWEHGLGGCESGFTIPDPTDSNIVWATCYGNEVTRYDARAKMARSVSPWLHTLDAAPNQVPYRCHWTPPLAIDPFDHNTVYYGCQMILRTTNGGVSWSNFSPDLSTKDPSRIISSGGIVGDNLGQFYGEVVFSIAPSDVQKGLVWAGTNDGRVWYTKDAGKTWNDVTRNITGLPVWGVVSKIEPSHFDPATAYIAVDFHLMDNRDPWLYKTTDFGKTWTKISDTLPKGGPLTYARVIAENPNRKGNLFAGTGNAFYYSLDDGAHWKQFKQGLPAAPVSWIVTQKQAHDVVISTYGRGMFIMEDITPLEQGVMELQTDAAAPAAKLVAPRPAYRMIRGQARALLSFWVKAAPKAPVAIEILDAKNQVIKKLPEINAHPGLNRTSWDLRHDPPTLVALRTTPPENPHIWEEPRFQNQEVRTITHWGLAQAEVGAIAAPGQYTVRMTVDGETFTQPLTILRTPDSHADDLALQSSVRLQLKVRDDITQVSNMTNQLEWMRKQLEDESKANANKQNLLNLIADMNKKLELIEYQLITRADALSDDKYFQTAYNLYQNFLWLNGEIGTGAGDVQGSGDWGATETAIGLVLDLEKTLEKVKAEYKTAMEKDVPAYNKSIEGTGLKPLPTTGAPPPPPRQPVRFGGE
jgi:photosystem II stability/assembly factor-like uncharacterized protein